MPGPPKPRGRPFRKGDDPRRHTFTREECQRGFLAAEERFIHIYGAQEGHWRIRAKIGVKPLREILRQFNDLTEEQFEQMCMEF